MKKGVVNTNSTATINVVNKAKVVVSGVLHENLKKQYDAVLALDEDENAKKAFYAELRTKRYSPDDINSDTIADDIAFIDDTNYLEKYKQTQQLLKDQASKAVVLEKELEQERREKEDLKAKIDGFEEYVRKEEHKKYNNAIIEARQHTSPLKVILKYYIWVVNIIIIAAFVVPSVFFMEHNWVNISAIAGFYVSIAVIINNFFKSKKRRFLELYS